MEATQLAYTNTVILLIRYSSWNSNTLVIIVKLP